MTPKKRGRGRPQSERTQAINDVLRKEKNAIINGKLDHTTVNEIAARAMGHPSMLPEWRAASRNPHVFEAWVRDMKAKTRSVLSKRNKSSLRHWVGESVVDSPERQFRPYDLVTSKVKLSVAKDYHELGESNHAMGDVIERDVERSKAARRSSSKSGVVLSLPGFQGTAYPRRRAYRRRRAA